MSVKYEILYQNKYYLSGVDSGWTLAWDFEGVKKYYNSSDTAWRVCMALENMYLKYSFRYRAV